MKNFFCNWYLLIDISFLCCPGMIRKKDSISTSNKYSSSFPVWIEISNKLATPKTIMTFPTTKNILTSFSYYALRYPNIFEAICTFHPFSTIMFSNAYMSGVITMSDSFYDPPTPTFAEMNFIIHDFSFSGIASRRQTLIGFL